jgi:hypothetical protein
MLVYHLGFHPISRWGINTLRSGNNYQQKIVDSLTLARKQTGKPVLIALRPPRDLAGMDEFLKVQSSLVKEGFPVFYSLESLAKAMSKVIAWRRIRDFKFEI